MGIPQQRERVTVDGLGNAGVGKYTETVEKSGKSGIMKTTNRIMNITVSSIENRHTGKGNPNAIITFGVEFNNRQKKLLEQLSEFDSRVVVGKKRVNMADLSALTAYTGDEFAAFTKGRDRLIIRGNSSMVNLDTEHARELAKQGYRWSGHTHPGTDMNCLMPSSGDKAVLLELSQNTSVIYNSKGQFATFERE